MKAIQIKVTGSDACVIEKPVLTSGTVGQPVEFTFDEAWEGLGKTAVFRAGSRSYPVSCVQNAAVVPWEVLEKGGVRLYIGVLGADEKGIVKIPTVWVFVDTIVPGTQIPDTVAQEPAAQVYDQILAAANQAVETVNDLREAADAGAFIGPAGPKGDAGVVEFIVVAELPAQNIKNAIYLVPEENADGGNLFAEFIFVDGAWEQIGSASVQVDLSDYAKSADVVPRYKKTNGRSVVQHITPNAEGGHYGVTELSGAAAIPFGYAIPVGDAVGRVAAATPTEDRHAATKGYVDGLFAELIGKIAELEAKLTGE